MANEFVARRGIIAQSGGAKITGSLLVSGAVDATGYSITAKEFTGSFSGSINSAEFANSASYVAWNDIDSKPSGIVSSSTAESPSQGTVRVTINGNNTDVDTGLQIGDSPTFTGLTVTTTPSLQGIPSSSNQIKVLLPADTISSSTQFKTLSDPFTGSFTGSFTGDGSSLTGIATVLAFSGSTGNDSLNLKTEALSILGSNGITTTVTDNTITVNLPLGTVSSSGQVSYTGLSNIPSGIVSSSTQVAILLPAGTVSSSDQVTISSTTGYSTFSSSIATKNDSQDAAINALSGITGSYATTGSNTFTGAQTISDTTNSTTYADGALVVQGGVGIAKDVNISGSLKVSGLLTVVSMSTQYVTSSQYTVGTSRVIVNDDDNVRFAGLSVVDSGSTDATGSLLWDSFKNHWIYEREDGGAYRSAVLIAGPKNYGTLGDEEELVVGRIPVATGGDHIDTNAASSSIYIDFTDKKTYVEAGLYVTGSVTSSVGFSGTFYGDGSNLTGIATTLKITGSDASTDTVDLKDSGLTFTGANGITATVANDTVTITAPLGTVSSSGQVATLLPAGTVSASTASSPSQGTVRVTVNGVNTDVDTGLQSGDSPIFTGLTVTTTPALAGIPSSSSQIKPLLPDGTVSSSAQYPGWVTASSQIQLGEITGTTFAAANFTFPQQLTVSGVLSGSTSAYINNTLYSGSTTTSIVGPVSNQVVAMLPAANYDGAFFDYVVKDGTNFRLGTVMSIWDGSSIEFTDTSTQDIGNTSGVSFAVDVNVGQTRLKITTNTGTWTVKTTIRAL